MSEEFTTFQQFNLPNFLMQALDQIGYEKPSPIQSATIPHLLAGKDVLGQAQTGTGKTAAFALPLLARLNIKSNKPQILVLAPTRELAIQVAEAFKSYAAFLPKFHVLPIYGGADMQAQVRQLQRGVHVIVGTPGRVMDHMRRGTLDLKSITTFVLDEADEMLRMGFIDDVEWILESIPDQRQIALFSATMPKEIRYVARKYLHQPEEITIEVRTVTAETIQQSFCVIPGGQKLDLLTRILEAENFDGILIFVRTKNNTVELAEKLDARGYSAAALNGDIKQSTRERIIQQLKAGKLDIIVATDVAARGLDVERVSHVINYDAPHDAESYVHRIGRTGRAGRHGKAVLFITPREKSFLTTLERATNKKIAPMKIPSATDLHQKRINEFTQQLLEKISQSNTAKNLELIQKIQEDNDVSALKLAAGLLSMLQEKSPRLILSVEKEMVIDERSDYQDRDSFRGQRDRRPRNDFNRSDRDRGGDRGGDRNQRPERRDRRDRPNDSYGNQSRFRKPEGDKSAAPQRRYLDTAKKNEGQATKSKPTFFKKESSGAPRDTTPRRRK